MAFRAHAPVRQLLQEFGHFPAGRKPRRTVRCWFRLFAPPARRAHAASDVEYATEAAPAPDARPYAVRWLTHTLSDKDAMWASSFL